MNNQCEKCHLFVDPADAFCRSCGTPIDRSNPKIDIKTGKKSTNIGVGYLPNANIHIGNRYETKNQEPVAGIERTLIKPVQLGNSKVKILWLTVSGAVGFVGSVASIISYWQGLFSINTSPILLINILFFVLFISVVLLAFSSLLNRKRFANLFRINIEADKGGNLYFTEVGGTCPKCGSDLKLKNVGYKDHKILNVVCKRNPDQHQWGFDSTVLPDLDSSSVTLQKYKNENA